jgi:DNA-binding NarL/FixJ family response regulator
VLLADDHPAFGLGLRLALQDGGCDIVAVVSDGHAAVDEARRLRPDIAVLDVRMPGLSGIEACSQIVAEGLASGVVILSTFDDAMTRHRAREAGARAYLTKETPVAEINATVRALLLDPKRSLLTGVAVPTFTNRELDVLFALGDGLSNKAIARRLGLSAETVKDHCSAIFAKLDVTDRVQAVIAARRIGLVAE